MREIGWGFIVKKMNWAWYQFAQALMVRKQNIRMEFSLFVLVRGEKSKDNGKDNGVWRKGVVAWGVEGWWMRVEWHESWSNDCFHHWYFQIQPLQPSFDILHPVPQLSIHFGDEVLVLNAMTEPRTILKSLWYTRKTYWNRCYWRSVLGENKSSCICMVMKRENSVEWWSCCYLFYWEHN